VGIGKFLAGHQKKGFFQEVKIISIVRLLPVNPAAFSCFSNVEIEKIVA
jgi:hypothetical protein